MQENRIFSEGPFTMQGVGDALDVGILGVDERMVITRWNRWLETATGKTAAAVVGRSLVEVEPKLGPGARAAVERAIAGATIVLSHRLHGYFLDIPAPSGYPGFERMQQSVRVLPIRDANGDARGAVALIQDVTERVARENELRAAMEAAQEANRAKSDFLASMSHELRTPIGAMSGYADLLADGLFGDVLPTQREQLLRIKAVGRHLTGIVEQILTFARIEAGRETLSYTSIDASQLARDAIVAVEPLVGQKGLELHFRPLPSALDMMTDVTKARQILINLLGNAAKFTESGSIAMDVTAVDQNSVAFAVSDTGPGIPANDYARIFEPFVRGAPSPSRIASGTGLGLSVSRNLARLLGGDVTVSSTVGSGSVFTATLPRQVP